MFDHCQVYLPPEDLADEAASEATFSWKERDLLVLSQSCDLVKGREKIRQVLLCTLWKRSEFATGHHLATAKGMEEARRGNLPRFHVLAECTLSGFEREVPVVDFSE